MTKDIINPDEPYRSQVVHLLKVLRGEEPERPLFGVEKITVVFLAVVQLLLLSTLLRSFTHFLPYQDRKRVIDAYAVGKVVALCLLLFWGPVRAPWLIALTVYLLADVIAHHLSRLLLPRLFPAPASVNRSIILLYVNLFEVIACYALLYRLTGSIWEPLHRRVIQEGMECLYFSFITFTTLGYGEFVPHSGLGKALVMLELATYFMFISTVIVKFVSQLIHKGRG